MNGYVGKILRVDLTNKKVSAEPLNMEWTRKYLGCQGLGARYLYEELSPKVDPLGPDNKILFLTGPLTGTIAPSAQKYVLVTKSPLTNIFVDSAAGGHIGAELKYAGYDGVIIEGRSEKPVYLFIKDGKGSLKNAARVWGKDSHTTEDTIKNWWGDVNLKVMSIGPAGENMVKFACVTTEYYRQNGRGGAGAVFGSKNLKAIAVRGSEGVTVAEPEVFLERSRKAMLEGLIENPESQTFISWKGGMGTPEIVGWTGKTGTLPTRNFARGTFEGFRKIGPKAVKEIRKRNRACFQCPMACSNFVKISTGLYAGTELEGPDYETICLLGSNCGVDDMAAITKMNLICDKVGMDTISAGSVCAWAIEAFQQGIITEKDTDGLALSFGDHQAIVQLLEKIAKREGIGDTLAEGVAAASEKLGKDSQDYAMHVKGMEIPAYEPRPAIGMGLAYATSPRGACHLRAFPISAELWGTFWLGAEKVELDPQRPEKKAGLVITQQHWQAYRFSTGMCDFALTDPESGLPDLVEAATGWSEVTDWNRIGERIVNTIRLFNLREGMTKAQDNLPLRFTRDAITDGPTEGRVIDLKDLEYMLKDYYKLRNWDKNGKPTLNKLRELEIEELQ